MSLCVVIIKGLVTSSFRVVVPRRPHISSLRVVVTHCIVVLRRRLASSSRFVVDFCVLSLLSVAFVLRSSRREVTKHTFVFGVNG